MSEMQELLEKYKECFQVNNLQGLYEVCERNEVANIIKLLRILYDKGFDIFRYMNVIPTYFFLDDLSLKSFTVPDTIINIQSNAFEGCLNLKDVKLHENLDVIGYYAFNGCKKLDYIHIPNSVTTLFPYAFQFCTNLKNVQLSTQLNVLEDGCFFRCEKLDDVVIPESVQEICKECFSYCRNLKNIYIPESTYFIDPTTFTWCSEKLVVSCKKDSYADEYCKQWGIQTKYV